MSEAAKAEALLNRIQTDEDPEARGESFAELVGSEHWKMVLAPHVLSSVCRRLPDSCFPKAAAAITKDESKIHYCLSLSGVECSEQILREIARHMRTDFVEHGLEHLRTAEGERAGTLEELLYEADPDWVKEEGARRPIRARLREGGITRVRLMMWLADCGNLAGFVEDLRGTPPRYLEEWSALGRAQLQDESFIRQALAMMGHGPEPLAYLLRLKPIPALTMQRALASAKPEWLLAALEVLMLESLAQRELLPLIELGARLGGKHLSAAVAWINLARMGPEVLGVLGERLKEVDPNREGSKLIWTRQRLASANRALEQGRKGEDPEPLDAAALVRQAHGTQPLEELVREIVEKPLAVLIEPVLHHLCAVNNDAAALLLSLRRSANPQVAQRVADLVKWEDVAWPEQEEDDLPDTFTPLGEGI